MGQTARAVGKAKSTISKDVRRGRISATRNLDGSVSIDAAELYRVYPAASEQPTGSETAHANDRKPVRTPASDGRDREQLLERISEHAEASRDLRRRLEDSEAERRRAQERLTALLTHRLTGTVPSVQKTETVSRPP
jgi:hypothetical protein